jgi:MoaD family protein
MKVKVKLLGIFREISNRDQVFLEFEKPSSLEKVLQKLVEYSPPEFKRVLIDPELGNHNPNILILVNGKEISILEKFETLITHGDEVVLIPVSHGG